MPPARRPAPLGPAELTAALGDALAQMKRVVVGQERLVERVFVSLLTGGHCLIEGVPGLAKTLTVSTLAHVVGGEFTRLQFTPDLVPADIVGTRIWRPSQERFDIEWGPVFANIVLADEINRAPAKVQSALLKVMAERQVSIGGTTRAVPDPYLVLATQNPIESEGVYSLPEAQRDRFLLHVTVTHPSYAEESIIAERMSGAIPQAEQVLTLDQVRQARVAVNDVYVHDAVRDYAVRLVVATRAPADHGMADLADQISLGASPRGTLGLIAAGRALAVLRGRRFLVPQDIYDVAPDVLRHRILLTYDAIAQDVTPDVIVNRVLSTVPAPRPTDQFDTMKLFEGTGGRMITGTSPPSAAPIDLLTKSAVLRRLELKVRRRLDGRLTGDYASAALGPGSDRSGARRYEPGDDARRMDWSLTARSLEPHVRTTDADRELDTLVVVDRSPSLDFGTARREKREVVLATLAGFGVVTARGSNRLSVLIAGGERLQHVPNRSTRAGLLAALSTVHDTPRHEREPGPDSDLAAALTWAHRTKRRRGQVVVASDFLDRTDWAGGLRRLALRHRVIAVHITDPREHELAAVGMLTLVDTESGRTMHVQTSSPRLRTRYADAARARHEKISRSIRQSGADYLHLSTGRDWVLDLAEFVSRRGIRG